MARTVAGATPGRTNRKFLIVALLFGAVTAALFYAITARGGGSGSSTPAVGDTQVVVAKVPIQQRTTITADMLQLKSISTSALVSGAYTSLNDAVGKVTKFPIEANQQVVSSAVVDISKPSTAGALSLVVPTGMRAVSIQASQVLTAGGLLLPGDYVDVVWECCSGGIQWQANGKAQTTSAIVFTRSVVQNVQVAAVAQSIVPSGPVGVATPGAASNNPVAANTPPQEPNASTITLLVTPEQAGILMMAESTGKLRATLRNPGDTNIVQNQSETQFVSPNLIPPDLMKIIRDTFSTTQ